jgi:hypothetical protein
MQIRKISTRDLKQTWRNLVRAISAVRHLEHRNEGMENTRISAFLSAPYIFVLWMCWRSFEIDEEFRYLGWGSISDPFQVSSKK